MDFALALASASQALNFVKQLREIDKSLSQGELKAAMADLYGKVADLKIALSDAKQAVDEKDRQIKTLQIQITALKSGNSCPICEAGRMKVVASVKDPVFGVMGVQQRTLKCDHCSHSEQHQHDPRRG